MVNYDSVNYASISQAMTEPGGLAVLGVLFRVRHITLVSSSFTNLLTEQQYKKSESTWPSLSSKTVQTAYEWEFNASKLKFLTLLNRLQ